MSRSRSMSFSGSLPEIPEFLPVMKRARAQSEGNVFQPMMTGSLVVQPPAKFITCTYQMLSDPRFAHLIHWDSEGRSFSIMDEEGLAKQVLPVFFKHANIASFVRQLHTYGFRKLPKVGKSKVSSFEHDKFQRGRPELLLEIGRRASDALSRQKGQIQTLQGQIDELRRQNARLVEDHSKLCLLTRQLIGASIYHLASSEEAKEALVEVDQEIAQLGIYGYHHQHHEDEEELEEEEEAYDDQGFVLGGGEGLGGFPAGFWSDVSPLSHQ